MTQERSSSNRVSEIKDAVLVKDQRELGPMRLPENRPGDFINHFNRDSIPINFYRKVFSII